jgi:hypothetical protein
VDVQDDVVVIFERPLDLASRLGCFALEELDEVLQALRPVRDQRIVLCVPGADVFRRGREVLLVDDEVVEIFDNAPVAVLRGAHPTLRIHNTSQTLPDSMQAGNRLVHIKVHGGFPPDEAVTLCLGLKPRQ